MIYDILMSQKNLSIEYLESKKDEIFSIMPELKNEDGFEQKSSWHIFDVWKHTEVALSNSSFDFEERLALLLHDIGKPFSYQDDDKNNRHFKGHALKSVEISEKILERLKIDKNVSDRVIFLIKNHSTVINPESINNENVELYRKLLDVQYCDTKAYNPEKTGPVLQRLDETRNIILEKIRNIINELLLSNSIGENQEKIFDLIPELKSMEGFEHNHPHHNLDVWNHTLVVLKNLNDSNDLELKMAGLLHDIGKPFSYQDKEVRHFHGHPEVSNKMTIEILNKFGYSQEFIENVSFLVLKHDTPIDPKNLDSSYEMTKKLLKLQYADAKAHHPDKIKKRTDFLDKISKSLDEIEKNDER